MPADARQNQLHLRRTQLDAERAIGGAHAVGTRMLAQHQPVRAPHFGGIEALVARRDWVEVAG